MNENSSNETPGSESEESGIGRRKLLQSMGKWSGAAITAVIAGAWHVSSSNASAGWINRRGGAGGWINGGGGGGGWINRRGGGGSWVNRW